MEPRPLFRHFRRSPLKKLPAISSYTGTMRKIPSLAVLLPFVLSTGCFVRVVGPNRMGPDEAAQRGWNTCRNLGFTCQLAYQGEVGNVWMLDYNAESPRRRGRMHIELNAWNRSVVRVQEPPFIAVAVPA